MIGSVTWRTTRVTGAITGMIGSVTWRTTRVTGAITGMIGSVTWRTTRVTGAITGMIGSVTWRTTRVTGAITGMIGSVTWRTTPVSGRLDRVDRRRRGVGDPAERPGSRIADLAEPRLDGVGDPADRRSHPGPHLPPRRGCGGRWLAGRVHRRGRRRPHCRSESFPGRGGARPSGVDGAGDCPAGIHGA